MKKLVLLAVLLGAMPITMMAQDDLYFVPTKENVAKDAEKYGMPTKTYYAGSSRSTDEYNRRAWSRVAPIDSAGNDIIDFTAERGVYPDSVYSEETDYEYTRRMSRFDDYSPSEAYWEGYRDGRWMSPWYYGSYYGWYDPWYSHSWYYDPWYYGGYYGYYSPYYYGWYSPWRYHYGYWGGWYRPYYYATGNSGANWSRPGVSHHKYSTTTSTTNSRNTNTIRNNTPVRNNNNSLGGYRSNTTNNTPRNTNSSSFGGGNRGGSTGGNVGRSTGGGHSYGGRR